MIRCTACEYTDSDDKFRKSGDNWYVCPKCASCAIQIVYDTVPWNHSKVNEEN